MTFVAFSGAVQLGMIFALLALGIFINYRILGVADLTVEGSFTAGAAISAVITVMGHPLLGIVAAVLVGAFAGLVTAFLQTKLKIQPILAGILTMTALYSLNLAIMGGRANVSLLREDTLFTLLAELAWTIRTWRFLLPFIVTILIMAALGVFFNTKLGLSIRATGDNADMVRASSINVTFTKSVGLMTGNAVSALCGGLIAQYQGFADIGMGFGMVVVALASLIIGETIFGRRGVVWNIAAVALGAVIYRIILALALSFRLNPANLRAISAAIVTIAISFPAVKSLWITHRLKRKGMRDA
ncbi:MAG: ABC transporter permease [Oscillospiraceae bacterium]|nr:ABC transporter permease [Oscillospiraceae bacterium]